MARQIQAGTADVSVVIRIIDSTDGTPETGVVFNTAGIDLQYRREGAASVGLTEATLAALTTAHADGGFLHIGNGYYRLDLPDAACGAGATGVLVHGTVTGMVVIGEYLELVAYNPYDGMRLGLLTLPNAAAEAAGGVYTRGTGAGQINQAANGMIDTNPVRLNNVSQSLLDLKDFADEGYDPATNKVQGLVLADAVTLLNGLAANVITATSIATGALPATKFAAGAFDAVWSVTARLLTAGTNIVLAKGTGVTGFNDLSAAQVNTEMDTALADVNLDHLVGTATGIPVLPAGTYLDQLADDGTATYDRTTDSLQAIRDRGDAAWITGAGGDPWATALPGAYGAGSAGNLVGTNLNATVASRATQTSVDAIGTAVDTEVAAIKAKTDQLTFTTTNKVDATIQAAGDFAQAAADKVWASATRTLTAFSTALALSVWDVLATAVATASSIGLQLKTNIDATISSRSTYAGTDTAGTTTLLSRIIGTLAAGTHQPQSGDSFARIGANGASLTALASQASVDDMPTNAELTTALAGADDATLAAIAAVQSDTNDLQARMPAALTAGGNMKSDMLALNGSTTAATQLARSANTMIFGTVDGTVSPTTTVFECADITEATTDHYKGRVLIFLSGALLAQATSISTYSLVSGRGRLTVVALTEAPTAGDTLIIV